MTSSISSGNPSSFHQWLSSEAQRQNTYPDLKDTSLSPAHVQKLWQCIDAGMSEDVGLNKLLAGLKQTNPAERAALVMSTRTQWTGTPHEAVMTPLMGAVATGVLGTVRTLLDQGGTGVQLGVKVGVANCNAMTVAAQHGLTDIMTLLSHFGRLGNVDALGVVDQQTPHPATVAWLRSQGVAPEQLGGAFENACLRRDLEGMKTLMTIGGITFAKHGDLLPRVIRDGDFEFARELVDLGAPLDMASLQLEVFGQVTGKKKVPVMAQFSPLELAIFNNSEKSAEVQNRKLSIKRPAIREDDGPKNSDDVAAAHVKRRALISSLVSKGAPVTTDVLKALIQQGDDAIYADIVRHREFWPTKVADVEVMRGMVDLNKQPFVYQMLTHQIEVMQGEMTDAKGKSKSKALASDEDDQRRREIASENFEDAANIVAGGALQIKLPSKTKFAAGSAANVEHGAPSTSKALVAFVKNVGKDAGSTPVPAQGRKLHTDEKPTSSKSTGLFSRFKKNNGK